MNNETYIKLSSALPKEAFNTFKKEDTGLDYDITSHNYQYAINRMNEILGVDGWEIDEESTVVDKNGMYEVTKKITVMIGKRVSNATGESMFQIETKKWNYGGGVSKSLADAHKSAITNGLKKTLAMLGVGKETYEQSIDQDVAEQLKVENKAKDVDEVKKIKTKILNCKTKEKLEKMKSVIEKSGLEVKDKTLLVNSYNAKLKTYETKL